MTNTVTEGFIRKVGKNYYMRLVVNGQKKQRATGTDDIDKATEMLAEWRTEERAGVAESNGRIKYETMRDEYIKSGKSIQSGVLRDLDQFFRGIYINAITVRKLDQFRAYRENTVQVLESKAETLAKEIELRTMKALNGRKKLPTGEQERIKQESIKWVENGTKATTNKRLTILRAMFNFLAKRGEIHKTHVPAFPILTNVDNKRTNYLDESDLENLCKEMPTYCPFLRFLYDTGMRSGQAAKLTWDMVDKGVTRLHVPGELTKNGEDFTLPLVSKSGEPIFDFVKDIKRYERNPGQPIFETSDFRSQWRQACDKLGLGIYTKETRAYRGAKPHDFRRTAARNLMVKGISRNIAMAITGHKTDSMYKRYAIADHDAVRDAFETLKK